MLCDISRQYDRQTLIHYQLLCQVTLADFFPKLEFCQHLVLNARNDGQLLGIYIFQHLVTYNCG